MIMISPSRTEWLACQENKTVPWPWRIAVQCHNMLLEPRLARVLIFIWYMSKAQGKCCLFKTKMVC